MNLLHYEANLIWKGTTVMRKIPLKKLLSNVVSYFYWNLTYTFLSSPIIKCCSRTVTSLINCILTRIIVSFFFEQNYLSQQKKANSTHHLLPLLFQLSQGELLEMHLLESRLLDTFFQNLDCSNQVKPESSS